MATRTFEQDVTALSHAVGEGLSAVGASVSAGLKAMGPYGRRFALTGFGAVLALSLGAATASAFRVPTQISDPAQPQDQTLAQSELPSQSAARAYALANPPQTPVKADVPDEAAATDPSLAVSMPTDDSAPIQAVYVQSANDGAASDDDRPTPPASAPAISASSDAANR